jgi:diapolycopene oxygenase
MSVIVIGAGVAGLASAIRMAVRGYKVDVFEANDYVGGKLSEIQLGDFRFDAGPSLYTMPEYFEELFALAGKNFQDYCPYDKLDVITHYFYPNGKSFKAYADADAFAAETAQHLGTETRALKDHLRQSAHLYDLTANIFLNKSLHTVQQQSAKDLLKAGLYFKSLDLFRTMHKANEKRFAQHPEMVQYFDRFATYNGSDPYQAPATLNIIPHLEHNIGAFFPKNGMFSLTQSMEKLAQELGVVFHLNQKVEEIIVEKKKAIGIKAKGVTYLADRVICNIDIQFAYRNLLKNQPAPENILSQPRSSSALIFYWGVNGVFDQLHLHNILFSKDYKAEFDSLFKSKTMHPDPTVYINITSKYNSTDAPAGKENWFVMINAPNNEGQPWRDWIPAARKNIIHKINTILKTDIEPLIEEEAVLHPETIESNTGSYRGALYGSASNNKMSAFLRHANFSKKIGDLYFCGGSVHPGGGIPLCMLSAKIVDDLMHSNNR